MASPRTEWGQEDDMEIQVIARGFPVNGQRLRARLAQQFWRLGESVARIELRLADLNGPRGGTDKECLLQLQTRTGQHVCAHARHSEWGVALAQATQRLQRGLRRLLERRRRAVRTGLAGRDLLSDS
ncbi:ribosome-associated translation inhibitor RaiA [Inhella inkyongensis]|uniref:Ribosome-associated translation inhibitor RaiA n=1 Tax=Inhella inkyongensis TaxID=392593 RepID=A0A840S563_9BURK|nr:HPF/RaiA family ribosome-associated protein [Inhella inkyongensis]MBB5204166.1 ribosome-associated translation inhibitor RaiA [Inhella inkyongensis]